MKKILSLILCLLLLTAFTVPAFALYYKDDIYRLNDFCDLLTSEEDSSLNEEIDGLVPKLGVDLPVYIFSSLDENETLEERAELFYNHNGFGYGDNKSGVILALSTDDYLFGIYRYGDAQTLISEEEADTVSKGIANDYSIGLSYYGIFSNYLTGIKKAVNGDLSGASVNSDGMPYWYPEKTSGFTDFHGENLKRVVDDANIFTDEQMDVLNKRMNEVVEKYGIGYALFTDTDNHGISPEKYSSDFLHFSGYGVGDNYGAVVFYLSLEPDNRCWRTTSINSYEKIFNAKTTFVIDELVDADIRAGRYYEAFLTHIDFVEKLFANGGVIPDEYESYVAGYANYQNKSSSISSEGLFVALIVAVILGTIVGGIHLSICISAMKVKAPVDAHEYLVKDSFNLRDKKVYYLYSTVTRTERQKSSGSSGGGSSFSSGSSSGGSYSSGGRSF